MGGATRHPGGLPQERRSPSCKLHADNVIARIDEGVRVIAGLARHPQSKAGHIKRRRCRYKDVTEAQSSRGIACRRNARCVLTG